MFRQDDPMGQKLVVTGHFWNEGNYYINFQLTSLEETWTRVHEEYKWIH